jgi:hypothetical protein
VTFLCQERATNGTIPVTARTSVTVDVENVSGRSVVDVVVVVAVVSVVVEVKGFPSSSTGFGPQLWSTIRIELHLIHEKSFGFFV